MFLNTAVNGNNGVLQLLHNFIKKEKGKEKKIKN